jgi:hypothetical protein
MGLKVDFSGSCVRIIDGILTMLFIMAEKSAI